MEQRIEAGIRCNDTFILVPDPQRVYYWFTDRYYPLDTSLDYSQSQMTYAIYDNNNWYTYQGMFVYRVGVQYYNTYQDAHNAAVTRSFHIQKRCVLCSKASPYTMEIFRKSYCLYCLRLRVIGNELFFGEGEERKDWTDHMLCDVLENMYKYLPAADQIGLPYPYPLPHNSFICCGKVVGLGTDGWYPGVQGHIAGNKNKCMQESCPMGHELCNTCANVLPNCLVCGSFIPFEEPGPDPQGCPNHCASFTDACTVCGQTSQRRKGATF